MNDENSEASKRRLAAALDRIASRQLDECPVCLEVPSAEDARVLRCCSAIMCRHCIPQCKSTCPFCRSPFQEGRLQRPEEGESPYTYSTKDYSIHSHFHTTQEYSSSSYTATHDYSAHTSYSATNDYSNTASAYTASREYSSSADYSSITDKYCASSAGSSEPG